MATAASFTSFAEPEPEAPTLSFGKHRGQPLASIEASYLEWVKTADRITPDLLAAIERELASRAPKVQAKDRWRAPQGIPEQTLVFARLIVAAGAQEVEQAISDYQIGGAVQFLQHCIDMAALESDPGDLPPF